MHEKEIEKLQAEKEKVERQLVQEQHIIQRLENRAAYYAKGERRKRAHRLTATRQRTPTCSVTPRRSAFCNPRIFTPWTIWKIRFTPCRTRSTR